MNEDTLHYIWLYGLYRKPLCTLDGETVEVINPGEPNPDAGPDFSNAIIRIGNLTWAGNVEIHIRASDWIRHGHSNDRRYDNVILHVVAESDTRIDTPYGGVVPQVCIEKAVESEELVRLNKSESKIKCSKWMSTDNLECLVRGFDLLVNERLKCKSEELIPLVSSHKYTWDELFYVLLCRTMGGGVNNEAFETLARSLPLNVIGRKSDNIQNIEALFLGTSGLLDIAPSDDYVERLRLIYKTTKPIFGIEQMDAALWKFAKMRPASVPTVRMAQLSALLISHLRMFTAVDEAKSVDEVTSLFDVQVSDYWLTHYYPGRLSEKRSKSIGQQLRNSIMINCVAPLLYAKDICQNKTDSDRSVNLLKSLPAEDNKIVRVFQDAGLSVQNAMQTQALIHLYKNYCVKDECLRCSVCDMNQRLSVRSFDEDAIE